MSLFTSKHDRFNQEAKRLELVIDDLQMRIMAVSWPSVNDKSKDELKSMLLSRMDDALIKYIDFLKQADT